ncbi:MAG: phosphatase PAP2 family protein [Myxococcales bacterium]|nr:phosphatase PAP2 family protein [Myxococcales bacterium]MCB9575774.1 phosphatase PAP2 family protein [Polyangiaceae bacterium]
MRAPLCIVLCTALAVLSGRAVAAPSQPPEAKPFEEPPHHRLKWRSEWRRFDALEYVISGAVAAGYLYVEFGVKSPTEPNWTGPILFDDGVRSALRGESRKARENAATLSDVFAVTPQVMVFADTILVPTLTDDFNLDVAWQMTAMNLQALSFVGLLTRSGHRFVARERPDVAECEKDPDYDPTCFGGSNASFPGGHSSATMTSAGLICAHHLNVPLYGGGAPDIAACGTAVGLGLATGWMRMTADRHYASDIIVGTVLGFGGGFGLPLLLHYRGLAPTRQVAGTTITVFPQASERELGLGLYGWF